jgi:hypothetical protein
MFGHIPHVVAITITHIGTHFLHFIIYIENVYNSCPEKIGLKDMSTVPYAKMAGVF